MTICLLSFGSIQRGAPLYSQRAYPTPSYLAIGAYCACVLPRTADRPSCEDSHQWDKIHGLKYPKLHCIATLYILKDIESYIIGSNVRGPLD